MPYLILGSRKKVHRNAFHLAVPGAAAIGLHVLEVDFPRITDLQILPDENECLHAGDQQIVVAAPAAAVYLRSSRELRLKWRGSRLLLIRLNDRSSRSTCRPAEPFGHARGPRSAFSLISCYTPLLRLVIARHAELSVGDACNDRLVQRFTFFRKEEQHSILMVLDVEW
jgi:hypothetical protein